MRMPDELRPGAEEDFTVSDNRIRTKSIKVKLKEMRNLYYYVFTNKIRGAE